MLWRSDDNLSYVLYGDGTWTPSNETSDRQEASLRGEAQRSTIWAETPALAIFGASAMTFFRGWDGPPCRKKVSAQAIQPFEQGFALASSAPVAS